MEEANWMLSNFLPRINQRFGVPAAQRVSAYWPVDPELELGSVLRIEELLPNGQRQHSANLSTIVAIFPGVDCRSYAGARAEVQGRLDGRLLVRHREAILTPPEGLGAIVRLARRIVLPSHPLRTW